MSGNTTFRLRLDGALAIERMMFQGEIMRFTSNGPWHCPGLFCSYYGFGSIVHRGEWNGSGKTWHFGALYEDILCRD